jgi:hypothetical protein
VKPIVKVDYRIEFESLFRKLNFSPEKVFKNGPRVLVAGGRWQQKETVFKASCGIATSKTKQGLQREALFLESSPSYLRPMVPVIYDWGDFLGKSFWYLVEWVRPGNTQNIGESDFLFKNTFFTQEALEWALGLLRGLRRYSLKMPGDLGLRENVSSTGYDLAAYRGLLEGMGKALLPPPVIEQASTRLDEAAGVYDRWNQTTLVHHEFYGSQILASGESFKLSDWENLGWGHPLRDFSTLWFRSFLHPTWQAEFLSRFKAELLAEGGMTEKEFTILLGVEEILQGFGNLSHFKRSALAAEVEIRKKATAFFRRGIMEALENSPR